MKLSKAQQSLLESVVARGGERVAEFYAPARKLVQLGLARWDDTATFGNPLLLPTVYGRNQLWTPKVGDEAWFVKSGRKFRITAIQADGSYSATSVEHGHQLTLTRDGLLPIDPAHPDTISS